MLKMDYMDTTIGLNLEKLEMPLSMVEQWVRHDSLRVSLDSNNHNGSWGSVISTLRDNFGSSTDSSDYRRCGINQYEYLLSIGTDAEEDYCTSNSILLVLDYRDVRSERWTKFLSN
jgi:hypothetical protein